MAGRFSVESVFRVIDKVTKPITRMQNRINKFTRKAKRGLRGLNKQLNTLIKGFKRVALVGAASLVLVTGAMGDVIRTGAEFEQTLVNAAAKFPEGIKKGTEAFKQLEKVARVTGATTEFTAAQAASGLNFLAMAGFNAEQSIAALPKIVDLATAAQVDLATASDIATDSLGAFGLATKDATQLGKNLARVNDVMAKTATTANTTMELMMETIKDGGPVATAAGASLETFLALTGELANAGIKGSKAGTTLKNVFLKLSAPVGQASTVMRRLGIETQDSEGNLRDVIDILEDFKTGLKGMGTAQQAAALNVVFGQRAIAGVNVLLKSGSAKLREYRKVLEGAGGAAGTMASVMRDTLQGSINAGISAFEGLKITLLKLRQVGVDGMIKGITDFIRSIDSAIQTNQEFANELIDGFIKIGKGILGLSTLIGVLFAIKAAAVVGTLAMNAWTISTTAYTFAVGKMSAVMKIAGGVAAVFNAIFAANPLGAIILAVTALIGLGVLLVKNWDNIVSAITTGAAIISSTLSGVSSIFTNIVGGVSSIFRGAKGLGLIGGEETGQDAKGLGPMGGGDAAEGGAESIKGGEPQIISPSDRMVKSIIENKETSTVDVNIKDETGRAEMSQKGNAPGVKTNLTFSGAF